MFISIIYTARWMSSIDSNVVNVDIDTFGFLSSRIVLNFLSIICN